MDINICSERHPRVDTPSTLNLKDFYTSAEEAGQIIQERWQNKELRKSVEEKFGDDIPDAVLDGPNGVMWRQICTPDREFARFLDLAKEANVKPLCFESVEDQFMAENFTKLALTNLPFMTGLTKNGKTIAEKEKIIDFVHAGGDKLCDLKTLWGEPLVDFHHWFLRTVFPITENRIVDIYKWTKQHGPEPREYYPAFMAFALAHYVLFDDYDLLAAEDEFTMEVVLPAFKEIEAEFGLRPLVVKLSKPGEHAADQYWWCYAKETRDIMEKHKKEFVGA
jgi:hypothetical protein